MEISVRDLWTVFHGMGFGALFMLAFTGAIIGLVRMGAPGSSAILNRKYRMIVRFYLAGMAVLAQATVFSGAYIWHLTQPL